MARRARSSRTKRQKPEKVDMKTTSHEQTAEAGATAPSGQATAMELEAGGKATFSEWFRKNRGTVLILLGIFILAFALRSYLYYDISFDTWPPRIVGNDPSYHQRVIEYVQDENVHLRTDPLLNYPLSGGNPRPPIFDWSIAIFGIILAPLFGFDVANSTWYVFQFAPVMWGALTVFPVYLLGKQTFGRRAGLMAAFFLALTASHIERSTLGFTDHDSLTVFFVVLGFYFISRAFKEQTDRRYIEDWRRPDDVVLGFRSFLSENRRAVLYSLLAGLSMTAIALSWQGYAYMMAILLIYYLIQLLLQRFRNEDSLGTFMIIFISMATVIVLSLPYYYYFSISTWSQGFYILLSMTALGVFIVPTRDIPWLIVLPTLLILGGLSWLILSWQFPTTAEMLYTGGGYFVKSKLYSTIAEAQAPDISRVVFIYGPATFFLALAGVVMAVIRIPTHMRKDYMVIVIWTMVAIFMSLSAIRFNFNATPAFAILAGWVLIETVQWLKAEGLSVAYSIIAVVILLVGLGVLSEGWTGPFAENYILLTVGPVVLGSLIFFGIMKYRKHREYFQFRKITVALLVGFVVMMPNVFLAVDAAIPIESKSEYDPDLMYLGSFGSSLHSEYWMDSYIWLSQQDLVSDGKYVQPEDRPAFMSWWDYGFDQLLFGEHPTAADNFQNGYQFTGSMIACQNETEAISLMTARLIEGDHVKNGYKFSDEVWDVLARYLGSDRNSTTSAYELERIYKDPSKYTSKVESNPDIYGPYIDITPQNAKYAAARGVMVKLGEKGVVDLYHDIREVTGKSLRYFAVDYRLFPFSSSNTGIFYAPIKLADRDTQDYLENKVYAQENTRGSNDNPEWTDYPDNPITMDKAESESERLGYKFRVTRYDMYYTDMFYNSLFYRTYIGQSPKDLGKTNDGKSVPGMFGDIQNIPPMQAWNMTHFKLVYRTMYYSREEEANASFPDDYTPMNSKDAIEVYGKQGGDLKSGLGQGVFYIKYYDGLEVSGRVRTERGKGVPNVRVTVLDDYGIPHGSMLTGENGEYILIAPPGEATLVVSTGELSNDYDLLYQFQVDQSTGQPANPLNITQIEVTDEMAMRLVDDGKMDLDLIISGKTVSGNVYWDLDGDSSYTDEKDELVTMGNISLVHSSAEDIRYGPVVLDQEGGYYLEDLVPGKYNIEFTLKDRTEVLITDFVVDPKESGERDLKVENAVITGHVAYANGAPAMNTTLLLVTADGRTREVGVGATGNYTEQMVFPGIYNLVFNDSDYYHDEVLFEIGQGDNLTNNLTLYPRADLELQAKIGMTDRPASGSVMHATGTADGVTRSFILDTSGRLNVPLPAGEYDLYIMAMERGTYTAYIGHASLQRLETTRIEPVLTPAVRVNGTLTRVVDTTFNSTHIKFIRSSDDQELGITTTISGEYSALLPRGVYKVIVDNTTSGNVSYVHLQDIDLRETPSDFALDIWMPQAIEVKGRIYWDKDENDRYTPTGGSEMPSGQDSPIQLAEDVPLADVEIEFTYRNGTLRATSGPDGTYTVHLPPGDFAMEIELDGFEPFLRELPVEGSVPEQNYGINDTDAMLVSNPREVFLNLSSSFYGKDGIEHQPVAITGVSIESYEPHRRAETAEFETGTDGSIVTELMPGRYLITLSEVSDMNGLLHTIDLAEEFTIGTGEGQQQVDLNVSHLVALKGQFSFIENNLVRYPAEMPVTFNAIKGERVSILSVKTDVNGNFEAGLPYGDFIMEAHEERPATHYMYWDLVSTSTSSSARTYRMEQGFPLDGSMEPTFNGIEDSEVFFEREGLWTTTGIRDDGTFSTFLLNGAYSVTYGFETEDSGIGGGARALFTHESGLTMSGARFGLELALERYVEVTGAVYHDINNDRTVDPEEKKGDVIVTFTPLDGPYGPVTATSNLIGDYKVVVPYTDMRITVEADGYSATPRSDVAYLNFTEDDLPFRDVPLVPKEVQVISIIYLDADGDSSLDKGEALQKGMEFALIDEEGREYLGSTDGSGALSILLPPGIYTVTGMRHHQGLPVSGYLGELNVDLGASLTDLEWPAREARRFSGTLYFKDTKGVLVQTLPEAGSIEFRTEDGGSIEAAHNGRTFSVDLPYYTYTASTSINNDEFGMSMRYVLSKSLEVNDTTGPEQFAMELVKSKDYSFTINLVNEFQHELEMGAGDTVRLTYFIKNNGNEPITVDVAVSEKPDGWTIDLPLSADIPLEIGGYLERQVNITSPKEPDSINSLKIEGTTTQSTKNSFQVQIGTAPSQKYDVLFDAPSVFGVGYNERRVFNVTVSNLGTGEDVVLLRLTPDISSIQGWDVKWEGENEFPSEGLNVSLSPRNDRRFAITITTPPGGNDSVYNERLTLTLIGKNRLGDTVTKSITFRTTRTNLVLPAGFLKLSNRRLDDPVLNRTIEANISVSSLYRDANNVKVRLKVDDTIVGTGTIINIPQDGTASTKVQFNVDDLNISVDDFHSFEVFIDPNDEIRESDDFDNLGVWYNIVVGKTPQEKVDINWKIILFISFVILTVLGVIAYRQRTNPI